MSVWRTCHPVPAHSHQAKANKLEISRGLDKQTWLWVDSVQHSKEQFLSGENPSHVHRWNEIPGGGNFTKSLSRKMWQGWPSEPPKHLKTAMKTPSTKMINDVQSYSMVLTDGPRKQGLVSSFTDSKHLAGIMVCIGHGVCDHGRTHCT